MVSGWAWELFRLNRELEDFEDSLWLVPSSEVCDDPIHNTHKAGYSSIEGVHVNCRRRNATEREASRWLRLIFDDRAFQLYRDEFETAIRCIEQYASRRYKLNLCKYWDAMKKETVLEFRG